MQSEVVSDAETVCPGVIAVAGQPLGAPCETVNVCPPTVIVPVRAEPVFAATVKLTVPFPEPLLLVVIHDTLLTADHAQLAVVVTVNEPLPPADPKF
jgi:hypothetical protein